MCNQRNIINIFRIVGSNGPQAKGTYLEIRHVIPKTPITNKLNPCPDTNKPHSASTVHNHTPTRRRKIATVLATEKSLEKSTLSRRSTHAYGIRQQQLKAAAKRES